MWLKIIYFFAFSPISTRRRIASERAGSSSREAAQASIMATVSSGHRVPICRPCPVAGRPRRFLAPFFLAIDAQLRIVRKVEDVPARDQPRDVLFVGTERLVPFCSVTIHISQSIELMINRLAVVNISHSSSTDDTYCIRGVRWSTRLASEISTSPSRQKRRFDNAPFRSRFSPICRHCRPETSDPKRADNRRIRHGFARSG